MAGFEENDLYEAFGLEQPAGENDPEPAEPGAEVQEQGAEPGEGSAQEPPEGQELSQEQEEPEDQDGGGAGEQEGPPKDGGDKPAQQTKEQHPQGARGIRNEAEPQTAAQRAENARRRRQEEQEAAIKAAVEKALAEEREKSKADMAAFFARANLKNTVTGKPITTMEEFDAWRADYDAAKLQKDLKAGKLTPEALRSAVEQTPALQELRKQQEQRAAADAEQKRAAAQAQVEREIAEIHKLDPSINSVRDLLSMENAKEFYAAVKRGNSFLDAYRLVNFDRLTAARAEAAKRQALNNARGKDHLTGVRAPQGTGAATVPKDEMEAFKLFNPDATEAEITAWYNKHKKT